MQAQAQKFYSSKSNAARAAKAAFGDNFKDVADLTEENGQFAYIAKAAPVSKRQVSEEAIRVLQGAIGASKTHDELLDLGRQLDVNRDLMTEGVYEALRASIHARADEITADEEAAAAAEHAAIEADRAAVLAQGDAQANEQLVADAAKLATLELTHKDNCPHCGINLENGFTDFQGVMEAQGSFAKAFEVQKHEYACLACGGEWGASIDPKRHISAIANPCRMVWELADQAMRLNGGEMPRRKDVLEACEAAGIAYYTARTQYQLWRTTQKEMEQRAAAQAKKA